MRFLPIAAVAVALLLPGTAHAAALSTTTVTYDASSAVIPNPGRGFFTYTETHLTDSPDDYVPLNADDLAAARVNDARSVVFRIFYLEKYRDVDTISKADLALIQADFKAARTAGVKMVIRFAYTSTDGADAPRNRVIRHIAQLRLTLLVNADVIQAIQAGFIGRWGEWYYSDNFTTDPSDPATVTGSDWARRKVVLTALLAATSASTTIQVRTPQIKRRLYPSGAQAARIGIHDDCFLAGTDDNGTFSAADDAAWLAAQSPSTLVGGETCEQSGRSGWINADREMAAYHWTYLNPSFDAAVIDSWGADGIAEAGRKLGYRFRLVDADLPALARTGTKVSARIRVTNEGYASPALKRPVRLVLHDGTRTHSFDFSTDVRSWTPGRTLSMTVVFTAPSKAGDYALYLNLPDPNPALAKANNAPYAIQMANNDIWDETHGWNALGVTLSTR
ncbi:MAG TPA: DUF4832 domain-containing protein [Actinoplanes sp.]